MCPNTRKVGNVDTTSSGSGAREGSVMASASPGQKRKSVERAYQMMEYEDNVDEDFIDDLDGENSGMF
jgi:hypothetical protein